MPVSSRVEDYMEAIFAIEISGREATVTDLADVLGVSKPTVVSAVRRLVAASLATHERYGSLALTVEGERRALAIYRRHEHLTFLFHTILGFPPERAESLACVMEHELDEESEARILGFVDYLARARREGSPWVKDLLSAMADERRFPKPLSMLPDCGCGIVARVTARGALRESLFETGFAPGAEVRRSRSESPSSLLVVVGGRQVRLRRAEAISVWVCPVANGVSTTESV